MSHPIGTPEAREDVRTALRAARGAFLVVGLFSFFINLLMLTAPLYMLLIYDRVLTTGSEATLIALTVLASGMLLVMGVLDLLRSRVLVRVGTGLDARLSERVFSAVFNQSHGQGGSERSQALRDLDGLRQFLTGPGPFVLFDAPWTPLFLAVVFYFHTVLGFVALAGAVALFSLAVLNELMTRRALQEANQEAMSAYGFAEASLRNADAVAAMGMLDGLRRRWTDRHGRALALQCLASNRAGALTAGSKAFRMFLQVAILGVGAALAIEQIITPGVMIAAAIITARALAPMEQAIGHWRHFVSARSAFGRLQALLETNLEATARDRFPRPEGHLVLENVAVVPPGSGTVVLENVSFSLSPGEALGVIGPSAAGKSTLARLLVGVWPPHSGLVRLDGTDLQSWNRADLGPHIGYLPQDVELFSGSVAENIARFIRRPDPGLVVDAARRAGVHHMILQFGAGYDTQIGENGSALSAGQRQRIGLARALYGDPVLVVLDEPDSNLDLAADQALAKAIRQLKARPCTVVIMAHRPNAIAEVDKLLMLRDGAVEALGPKDQVLARVARTPARMPDSGVASIRPAG